MPENEIEVTKSDFILAQHREAAEYAQYGMYEHINPQNFQYLSQEELAYYQISARAVVVNRLREIRNMVVNNPDAFSRVVWQIRSQEMVAEEIIGEVYPESGIESSPVLLGGQDITSEIDWYIDHGIPEALNVLNIPALESFGNDNIEVLKQQAEKRREVLGIDSPKTEQMGFGRNGSDKVK